MPSTDMYLARHWDYAKATLDALQEFGLRPTPELYHVWFVYHAEENPEIIRQIAALKAKGQTIDENTLLQLYYRFVFDKQAVEFMRRGMEDFSKLVERSDATLINTRDELKIYGAALNRARGQMADDAADRDGVMRQMELHTGRMQNMVETLHDTLGDCVARIAVLQKEIEEMRERSSTDGLTGVANRTHFEDCLIRRCQETDGSDNEDPFCLMMVDLDQFKSVNDQYGHRIGDEILVLIAGMIKANTKGRDLVARYGGDEFIILLPHTDLASGQALADDMCKRIAAREIRAKSSGTSFGHLTISVGIAQYQPQEGPTRLIDRADRALYDAKKAGRNRSVVSRDA